MKNVKAVQPVLSYKIAEQLNSCRALENSIAAEGRDIETLHDYRVALRRCRALLGLFREAYPPPFRKVLSQGLKELAHNTSQLRDLDVFLSLHAQYQSWVADKRVPDLDLFFGAIAANQQQQAAQLQQWLGSYRYKQAMQQLVEFFTTYSQSPEACRDDKQVKKAVKAAIARQRKKINRITEAIERDGREQEIHQLRIEYKKLRYLLEAFGYLFKKDKFREPLRQLKQQQETLGQFNDCAVQLASIENFSALMPEQVDRGFIARLQKKLTGKKIKLQVTILQQLAAQA
ncbi:CHAD domain-containing protein [Reinekea marinisedimentorum]|uniref:CHAD domain-containing protein n=1 Tax=Reinekea marinisedimentorum TaxID=230495 RepID=A0A4R3HZB0_9GAMM|nr:CHAD domain-containing protein [Reinekea marinisedimentorum]TCS38737.1 CHAD domain-containing protein [Reinekea marinisedimentorum]